MRKAAWRLAGAVIMLGLAANAGNACNGNAHVEADSEPFPAVSAVIVHPKRLISSDRIDGPDASFGNRPITEWKYDAEFTVTNRLGGPDLGRTARISFIDQREWGSGRLFMIVHRDGLGRLWARRAWKAVDSQLCLSAQQVAKFDLFAAFSNARDNSQGLRCITI